MMQPRFIAAAALAFLATLASTAPIRSDPVRPPIFMAMRAYVANAASNTVSELEPTTRRVSRTIRVGVRPSAVLVVNTEIYVANAGSNSVTVIDGRFGRVETTIPVGASPDALGFRQGFVYVANAGDDDLSVIDAKTHAVTGTIRVGKHPSAIEPYVYDSTAASTSPIATATRSRWFPPRPRR